jgi:hypothetical protein
MTQKNGRVKGTGTFSYWLFHLPARGKRTIGAGDPAKLLWGQPLNMPICKQIVSATRVQCASNHWVSTGRGQFAPKKVCIVLVEPQRRWVGYLRIRDRLPRPGWQRTGEETIPIVLVADADAADLPHLLLLHWGQVWAEKHAVIPNIRLERIWLEQHDLRR